MPLEVNIGIVESKSKFAEATYKLWVNGYPQELWLILAIAFLVAIYKYFYSITFLAAITLGQEISLSSKKVLF